MRKRAVSILLAMVLVLSLAVPAYAAGHPFTDVPENAWYAENVEYVYNAGLMKGITQTTFGPDQNMTRAMLVTVLYRYDGSISPLEQAPFTDLAEDAYYLDAVHWAYENGIVMGATETTFCPDEDVTREQIVTIFYRYAQYLGRDTDEQCDLTVYPDADDVSGYAWEAFSWAVAAGIIKGSNGCLEPGANTLRSQCAAILSRFDGRKEPDNTKLYVLMYHSVVPDGTPCNDWEVTETTFLKHMQWLQDHGYTTVAPRDLLSGEELPDKAVMITFDDGYANNYELAFPILQEFEYKAVINVVVSNVDQTEKHLTWDMCREMVDSGLVELGSHTYNLHQYPGVGRLSGETRQQYTDRVFPDVEESYYRIYHETGVKPVTFAYPNGVVDEWVEDYLHGFFPVTLVGYGEYNDVSKGVQTLTRYNVNEETGLSKYLK